MNHGTRAALALLASGTAALLTAAPAVAAVTAAAPGDPSVVNQETVQVELDPSGDLEQARLFTQLTAYGHGTVEFDDPTSTRNLRNLDGFGSPSVSGGNAHYSFDVDGSRRVRTVADYDKDLPLVVDVGYTLDGHSIDPADIPGSHGRLQVRYHVVNNTAKPTPISYLDGKGKKIEETVDVVTPLVGQLSTTLPPNFSAVDAPRADVGGDGRGSVQLIWTMVLFSPIGQTVQDFGWSADLDGGGLPKATVQAVPVPPERKPELKFGADGFKSGAQGGQQLTYGAGQVDANLVKLAGGAGELMTGLNKLADGTRKLKDGLAGGAAAGAGKLADGVHQVKNGTGKLSKGFNSTDGSDDLVSGTKDLATGLKQIRNGLDALAADDGMPAAYAATVALRAGVDSMVAGIGDVDTTGTLLNGLAQLAAGNDELTTAIAGISAGADELATGLPAAKAGVDAVKGGLDASLVAGTGDIAVLYASLVGVRDAFCGGPGACTDAMNAVIAGIDDQNPADLDSLRDKTTAASAGLGQVSSGLADAVTGLGSPAVPGQTMRYGLAQVAAGMGQSGAGMDQLIAGLGQLKGGLSSGSTQNPGLAEGLDALGQGMLQAVTGISLLAGGTDAAAAGAGKLAAGVKQTGDGVMKLDSGLGLLATGADQLAAGLGDAADGAGQLADGADEAAAGAGQIGDGADQLHSQGTSALVVGADQAARTYGKQYAIMQALDARAADGALPYGAPKGATGSAAYAFELAASTGDGGRSGLRALFAALVFGAAAALGLLARRRPANGGPAGPSGGHVPGPTPGT